MAIGNDFDKDLISLAVREDGRARDEGELKPDLVGDSGLVLFIDGTTDVDEKVPEPLIAETILQRLHLALPLSPVRLGFNDELPIPLAQTSGDVNHEDFQRSIIVLKARFQAQVVLRLPQFFTQAGFKPLLLKIQWENVTLRCARRPTWFRSAVEEKGKPVKNLGHAILPGINLKFQVPLPHVNMYAIIRH